ncbi:GumC family protein [Flavobacterium luteum]|uniref:non-specific protein-tyrosine kinase n=1 Tax=Flavobacterium luteum TaxID=2026654 RepID=A0A7J5AE31_9FLAO|nr:polysaccharide biosynthesis tyrosine autokinase [Flavobacterium luteum]KAB1155795.1 polysaccharide biosynthesis tyrosine autokinase [Flavobacterium luteum]
MSKNKSKSNTEKEEEFYLKDILSKYIVHWKWFFVGIISFLIAAFLHLRYATPEYRASTTILVKDEKKGGMLSELSAFADIGLVGGLKSNVDNEIEILKSRTLVESTVKMLDLNISMFIQGKINDIETYKKAPIKLNFINRKNKFYESKMIFNFIDLKNGKFQLESNLDYNDTSTILSNKKEFLYGEIIHTENGDLIINRFIREKNKKNNDGAAITIVVSPIDDVVDSFKNRIEVTSLSKTSSVVSVSITDPVIERAEIFLNNLIQIYNENAVSDKNLISEKTSEFIANRLKLITQELDGVEQDVEIFKKTNKLTNIETDAKLFLEGSSEYNKKILEAEIQSNVVYSLLEFMKNSTNSDLLPTNIVSGERDASELINSYNELILNRNRILKTATSLNPVVVKMDQDIQSLKSTVTSSLKRLQTNLAIQKRDLKAKEGSFNSKIGKIPVQERQFRVIARQQKVKEELYLYLLQKREETAISLSATEPNARVVDLAKALKEPVSPKKNVIYFAAFLLGLFIPFAVIYVNDLLDNKIKSRLDLEGKTNIPFIGDIPTSDSPLEIMRPDSRSSSAEALRIIRSNLDFMVNKDAENSAKTIFVTSTIPQEGKTFVSANLAATFALSGDKVLLIEMDIRCPRLGKYLNIQEKGVTNYLSSKDLKLEDLIAKQEGYDDFHVLSAGNIPPNPAELLMNKKVDSFFEYLKTKYDYIIVDTAPVSVVADTILIAKQADCFVYVFRANFLGKRMLSIPNRLCKEGKLPNMCLLLNDTNPKAGNGFGYGYGNKSLKKHWYQNFLNF